MLKCLEHTLPSTNLPFAGKMEPTQGSVWQAEGLSENLITLLCVHRICMYSMETTEAVGVVQASLEI